ncbi:DUF58 domain-containing protein [Micromonospora sp. NPDC049559]|uniref:DUF58 domain-containing protein n=1 Tax=Micromonospora sp. NPDC049559 TaxID=3155923 RepID=UPI0034459327
MTWRVPALLGGLGALATLLAALAGASTGWWLSLGAVTGVVLLLTALDWLAAAPAGEVRLARSGARRVRLGESARVTLTVTNTSVRTLRGLVRDAWVPSAGAGAPYAHPILLDPGESVDVVTTLTPTRRGDRPAARVTIRSYGPLGLAFRQTGRRRAAALTPPWTLTALPPFASRRFLPEKLSRLRIIEGRAVTRGRGQGTEFDSLREYVVGDDVRSIDWRGTARREHVAVKTWRPERDRRVLCVIDTGRTSAGRVGTVAPVADGPVSGTTPDGVAAGEPRLDAAIDAALLLATLATQAHDRVDLLAVDAEVRARVPASTARDQLARLTRALAGLRPALVETDFARVVAEVLRIERKRALVVIFTTLDPGALGDGLLPVLPRLVARHTVMLAAVHDPSLEALAAARDGTAALHTAAAAERSLAELDRVRAALSRSHVHVVDAPVETFASAVADRYLALKAAGRL